MGMLIEGKWEDVWYDTKKEGGKFVRKDSQFRSWVLDDPYADYPAVRDRYHLYVSLACPWAHRTLIVRKLKALESVVSVSIVDPMMGSEGWVFSENDGCIPDMANGFTHAHQIYTTSDSTYTGRVTVPILWDKLNRCIVNNESSEIVRIFNRSFGNFDDFNVDLYPEDLEDEIDRLNDRIYPNVNNGVYKAGFATSQEAYEDAVEGLFDTLHYLEGLLDTRRYLTGDTITEADWRLFPTLVRFDPVYVGHFKCNIQRIADFKNLSGYLKDLYQQPGIAETCNFDHIKRHYYGSHPTINPSGVVPKGPIMDLDSPHGRG